MGRDAEGQQSTVCTVKLPEDTEPNALLPPGINQVPLLGQRSSPCHRNQIRSDSTAFVSLMEAQVRSQLLDVVARAWPF